MSTPTRSRILDYLRKEKTASAVELARSLELTAANIRHHLGVLEGDNQVEVLGQRRQGRGHPVNIYGLTRNVLGDGLSCLSDALLDTFFGGNSPLAGEDEMRSVANKIGVEYFCNSSDPLLRRLSGAVGFLCDKHYEARWEAGASGARVILGHCPYQEIVERHPDLCILDALLLEKCIGQKVRQQSRLELTQKGNRQCVFLVLDTLVLYS